MVMGAWANSNWEDSSARKRFLEELEESFKAQMLKLYGDEKPEATTDTPLFSGMKLPDDPGQSLEKAIGEAPPPDLETWPVEREEN